MPCLDRLPLVLHRNLDTIVRFGRFPERNSLLGRNNTQAEAEWLEQSSKSTNTLRRRGSMFRKR